MKEQFGIPSSTEHSAEGEARVEQLSHFIESLATDYRERFDMPVDNDGRIDMGAYRSLYPNVEADIFRTAKYLKEGNGGAGSPDEIARGRRATDGEKLEMLAFASFAKNLGPQFIIARASHHDDQVNKVDTIIFDAETGNLVCAFDEVSNTGGGADYQKKQAGVQELNMAKGGATLKYGIRLEKKSGQPTIELDEVNNIPLFYVALPKDHIEKGIREFTFSRNGQSDFEKKLFEYFIGAIGIQIKGLELYAGRLNPSLRERLEGFKKITDGLQKRK